MLAVARSEVALKAELDSTTKVAMPECVLHTHTHTVSILSRTVRMRGCLCTTGKTDCAARQATKWWPLMSSSRSEQRSLECLRFFLPEFWADYLQSSRSFHVFLCWPEMPEEVRW